MTCGWHGTLDSFLAQAADGPGEWLRVGVPDALAFVPAARGWQLFLEFEAASAWGGMPGPDAVIQAGTYLLAMVRIDRSRPSQALLDRAMACNRAFRRRYPAARKLSALPVLVLTGTDMRPVLLEGVCVTSPVKLHGLFKMLGLEDSPPAAEPGAWLSPDADGHAVAGRPVAGQVPIGLAGAGLPVAGAPAAGQADGAFSRDLVAWAAEVLDGHFPSANLIATLARDEGLDAYLTRDRQAAADYVAARFDGTGAAEARFPVVEWGVDLTWDGERWTAAPGDPRLTYRSRLGRGLDGLIVVVPPVPALDTTFGALSASGLAILPAI